MKRRVIAPFVGIALALSMAVTPVSAVQQTDPFICATLASVQVPNNPFFQIVWARFLNSLGCGNHVTG